MVGPSTERHQVLNREALPGGASKKYGRYNSTNPTASWTDIGIAFMRRRSVPSWRPVNHATDDRRQSCHSRNQFAARGVAFPNT